VEELHAFAKSGSYSGISLTCVPCLMQCAGSQGSHYTGVVESPIVACLSKCSRAEPAQAPVSSVAPTSKTTFSPVADGPAFSPVVPSTSLGEETCKDSDPQMCTFYKKQGQCKGVNAAYMASHCPASCDLCVLVSAAPTHEVLLHQSEEPPAAQEVEIGEQPSPATPSPALPQGYDGHLDPIEPDAQSLPPTMIQEGHIYIKDKQKGWVCTTSHAVCDVCPMCFTFAHQVWVGKASFPPTFLQTNQTTPGPA
jgi:hypothetical protein